MYFFSMSASALSNFKQNLEKLHILGKLVKLRAWMKEYFSVILYSYVVFFRFSVKSIKALMRITVVEVAVH